ncbi:hypothetical protein AB0E67_11240 [Streptomyces sp. NPDC032161]|uniref:hypothetical protein n=1 Tax=unclassified Streptomyces TaxID=2593676 RepID=UPI0033C5F43A
MDQGASSCGFDRKAEEGVDAAHRRPTTDDNTASGVAGRREPAPYRSPGRKGRLQLSTETEGPHVPAREHLSESSREPVLGCSRAFRVGNQVFAADTTAGSADGAAESADAAARAREIFGRIDAGFDPMSAVHGDGFRDVLPVTTVAEVGVLAVAVLLVETKADPLPQ